MAFGVLVVAWVEAAGHPARPELFHFEGPDFLPAFAAWAWLGVYIVIPVGLAILIVIQLRMEGEDPPRPAPDNPQSRLPDDLRRHARHRRHPLVAADTAIDIWPWPLTPLTSHALSAWFLGVGVLAALTVWENDLQRSRYTYLGSAVLGLLLAVALARYGSDIEWEEPVAWVLCGLIALVIATGTYGLARARGGS